MKRGDVCYWMLRAAACVDESLDFGVFAVGQVMRPGIFGNIGARNISYRPDILSPVCHPLPRASRTAGLGQSSSVGAAMTGHAAVPVSVPAVLLSKLSLASAAVCPTATDLQSSTDTTGATDCTVGTMLDE